jgi:predicted ABC-type ATPase
MIGGPNGSGKTTLFKFLRRSYAFSFGHCQNPDDVELQLRKRGLDLHTLGIKPDLPALKAFLASHPLAQAEWQKSIRIVGNVVRVSRGTSVGYLAAVLCDFVRRQWLLSRETFSFETVMSSPDKIELLRSARAAGYRSYLYFVCTESFAVNFERVAVRKALGGHGVPREKIEQRYHRSLSLLGEAVSLCNRAFLFDNTSVLRMVAEFCDGRLEQTAADIPAWVIDSAINKLHGR